MRKEMTKIIEMFYVSLSFASFTNLIGKSSVEIFGKSSLETLFCSVKAQF